MAYTKLNILQRGILQTIFSVSIASLCMIGGQFVFIQLYLSGLFTEFVISIFFVVASGLIVVIISISIMKQTMKLNITTKVTIQRVIEFSYALQ